MAEWSVLVSEVKAGDAVDAFGSKEQASPTRNAPESRGTPRDITGLERTF